MAFPVLLLAIVLGSTFSKKLDDVTLGGALNQGVLSLILLIGLFTWFYPARTRAAPPSAASPEHRRST